MRMYFRSLSFVLQKAVDDVLPGKRLRIEHAISKGYYCEIEGLKNAIGIETVIAIYERMQEIKGFIILVLY